MWTRIMLLLQDQSDLGLHCLKRLKHLSRLQRQTTFIEIGDRRFGGKYYKFETYLIKTSMSL